MKKFITILLILAMAVSLAACGNEETLADLPVTEAPATEETQAPNFAVEAPLPSGESVALTWSSWAMADPEVLALYQTIADAYNESNSYNITVTLVPPAEGEDFQMELLFDAASGIGPDVAQISAQWLPQLLELGVVRCLNSNVSQAVMEDHIPGVREAVVVNGELMALPWYARPSALLVNRELCARAQVDPAAIASWEDLMAAAEKIAGLEADVYGLGIPASGTEPGEGYHILPVLWARGGEFQTEGQIRLESEAALQACADLQKLFSEKISPEAATVQELRSLFAAGKLGFYWDTEEEMPEAQALPFPGCLDTQVLAVLDSCGQEKMAAAAHFMDYLSGEPVISQLREAGHSVMSGRRSVQAELFAGENSYAQAMEQTRSLPVLHLRFQEVDGMLSEMLRELAQGGDVAGILTKWDAAIQEVYDD